jgi:hypothetical protein
MDGARYGVSQIAQSAAEVGPVADFQEQGDVSGE